MKYRIQLGLIIILVIVAVSLLLSQNANPDNTLFFGLKRVQEKSFLKLKSNAEDQVNYMSSLLDVRLEELQNLVKNKNYDFILPAASRYSTLAGRITELIEANNLAEKEIEIKNQFLSHQKILDALYIAYPKNIPDNVEWKYIQDDFNYLKIYLDKLTEVK